MKLSEFIEKVRKDVGSNSGLHIEIGISWNVDQEIIVDENSSNKITICFGETIYTIRRHED